MKARVSTPLVAPPALEPPRLDPVEPGSLQWGYLRKGREIPERLIQDLRPHRGPDPYRVYLPFYPWLSEQPCYFIGRNVLGSSGSVYWNPPLGLYPQRKSTVLWGLHRIRKPLPAVLVCEGVFDALWFPGAVAVLGKTASEAQIDLMNRVSRDEIIVMLDGDLDKSSGFLAEKIARRVSRHVSVVDLPAGKDPDDLCRKGVDLSPYLERRRRIV